MDHAGIRGLVKFGNLQGIIATAVTIEFGSAPPAGIEEEVDRLLTAVTSRQVSNFETGLAASALRARFKADQAWMAVGNCLAKQLGRSYSYLDGLMKAAEEANQVAALLLAALIEAGYDPTETKYAGIIDDLRHAKIPNDSEEARALVLKAIEKHREAKRLARQQAKKDKAVARHQLGPRLAKQMEMGIKAVPDQDKVEEARALLHQLAKAAEDQCTGWKVEVSWSQVGNNSSDQSPSTAPHPAQAKAHSVPGPAEPTLFDPVETESTPVAVGTTYVNSPLSACALTVTAPDLESTAQGLQEPTSANVRRPRKKNANKNGEGQVPPASTPHVLSAAATTPNSGNPGDALGHAGPLTILGSYSAPGNPLPSQTNTSAQASGPAIPKATADPLTTLVKEVINCIVRVPTGDGGFRAVADPAQLARIEKARNGRSYMFAGAVDVFDAAVDFLEIRKVLSRVLKAHESTFRVFTKYPERVLQYERWENAQDHLWRLPVNLWIGVQFESAMDMASLDSFATVDHVAKSVSFVGFRSDPAHPLVPCELLPRIRRCELREIVTGAVSIKGVHSLTPSDANCLEFIVDRRELGCDLVAL